MVNDTIAIFLWYCKYSKVIYRIPILEFYGEKKNYHNDITELRKSTGISSKNVLLASECSNAVDKKPILITVFILKSSKTFLLSKHSNGREDRGDVIKLSGRNT